MIDELILKCSRKFLEKLSELRVYDKISSDNLQAAANYATVLQELRRQRGTT